MGVQGVAVPFQAFNRLGIRRYARWAGVAMLLSIVFGLLGEMVLPDKIVAAVQKLVRK